MHRAPTGDEDVTIEWRRGDMFASRAEAIVCAANARGILGAGQALEVRKRYPEQAEWFRKTAASGAVKPGQAWCGDWAIRRKEGVPVVFFATTKGDPRQPARLEWVDGAAANLARSATKIAGWEQPVRTVAVPALGCGMGELRWVDVKPILERMADSEPGVRWLIYEPMGDMVERLAWAIAAKLDAGSAGGMRANVWVRDGRVRVYLASAGGSALGWIAIDPGLGLHATGNKTIQWMEVAEAVKVDLLRSSTVGPSTIQDREASR